MSCRQPDTVVAGFISSTILLMTHGNPSLHPQLSKSIAYTLTNPNCFWYLSTILLCFFEIIAFLDRPFYSLLRLAPARNYYLLPVSSRGNPSKSPRLMYYGSCTMAPARTGRSVDFLKRKEKNIKLHWCPLYSLLPSENECTNTKSNYHTTPVIIISHLQMLLCMYKRMFFFWKTENQTEKPN